jgi:hypothetical protein
MEYYYNLLRSLFVNTPGPFIPYYVGVSAVNAVGEGIATLVLNFTREGGQ